MESLYESHVNLLIQKTIADDDDHEGLAYSLPIDPRMLTLNKLKNTERSYRWIKN